MYMYRYFLIIMILYDNAQSGIALWTECLEINWENKNSVPKSGMENMKQRL